MTKGRRAPWRHWYASARVTLSPCRSPLGRGGRSPRMPVLACAIGAPCFRPKIDAIEACYRTVGLSYRPKSHPPLVVVVVVFVSPHGRQVVFLPHTIGSSHAVLTVATSAGDIRYKVLVGHDCLISLSRRSSALVLLFSRRHRRLTITYATRVRGCLLFRALSEAMQKMGGVYPKCRKRHSTAPFCFRMKGRTLCSLSFIVGRVEVARIAFYLARFSPLRTRTPLPRRLRRRKRCETRSGFSR